MTPVEIDGLLAPTEQQRNRFAWFVEMMDEGEMQELLLHAFSISGPLERSELLRAASEITGIQLDEGRRR